MPRIIGQFNREWREIVEREQEFLRQPFRPSSPEARRFKDFQEELKELGVKYQPTLPSKLRKETRDANGLSPATAAFLNTRAGILRPLGTLYEDREDASPVAPRRDNVVAKQMKMLREASAADARRFHPNHVVVNVHGAPALATYRNSAPVVRRLKRREVLFAKRVIGRRR